MLRGCCRAAPHARTSAAGRLARVRARARARARVRVMVTVMVTVTVCVSAAGRLRARGDVGEIYGRCTGDIREIWGLRAAAGVG